VKILIVDDERAQREIIDDIIRTAGYETVTAETGSTALDIIADDRDIRIILTDLKMPGIDGLELLEKALNYDSDIQVIIMTAFGSIPGAVRAIKRGAYDYLAKPFRKEDLLLVVERAREKIKLLEENRRLKAEVDEKYSYGGMIGKSAAMREVFQAIERVKETDATVLIEGESGTGKELVAKAIHYNGRRKGGPFVALNCGAIPENLIESELFGFEKGTFTGAAETRPGKFELARGGTIFLDEIGTMRLDLQTRLLRVLEEKKVQRLGSSKNIELDVRIIAATNTRLEEEVLKGNFRNDLYHRLNVFTIELAPLSQRKEDIPLLVDHFLKKMAGRYGKKDIRVSPEALQRISDYDFPGNIRELENILEKAVIISDDNLIKEKDISLQTNLNPASSSREALSLFDKEKNLIEEALRKSRGSIKKASQALGISYKTLQYRLRKYGIDKNKYK
jgi:two-component system response regulator PilR (NtrC family)